MSHPVPVPHSAHVAAPARLSLGFAGGLFRRRRDALTYAAAGTGRQPDAVRLADTPLDPHPVTPTLTARSRPAWRPSSRLCPARSDPDPVKLAFALLRPGLAPDLCLPPVRPRPEAEAAITALDASADAAWQRGGSFRATTFRPPAGAVRPPD